MNFKALALAAAISCAAAPAFAGDQTIDLSSGNASFSSKGTVLSGGEDVLTFSNLAAGSYNFVFNLSSLFISDLTATLNGQSAKVSGFGPISFAFLQSSSNKTFELDLTGNAYAGFLSSYSGSLTVIKQVSAVPEPETYALMLAGLGVVGLLARRRRAI